MLPSQAVVTALSTIGVMEMSKSARITIRVSQDLRDKIDEQSKKDATDIASFIRKRITEYFSQTNRQSRPNQ